MTEVLPAPSQLGFPGADFSAGWDVVQSVQEAKQAGTYSLVRVQHRQAYEQVARWLLEGMSVNEVARLSGWAWRTVSAIRCAELSRMSELKQRIAREELETAMLCNERIREALEQDRIEPRDLGIIKGISLQRAVELMGAGGDLGAQKGAAGLRAEDLRRFLDQHIQALPSCKVDGAQIDSASVANASVVSGLRGACGSSGGDTGGSVAQEGPGAGSSSGPALATEQAAKGGAGGVPSPPGAGMPDGFIPQKF